MLFPVSVDEEHARIALHVGFSNTKVYGRFPALLLRGKHQSLGFSPIALCIGVFQKSWRTGLLSVVYRHLYIRNNRFVVLVEVEGGFFVCNFERSVSGRCEPVCHSFIVHSENEVEMFPKLNVISL